MAILVLLALHSVDDSVPADALLRSGQLAASSHGEETPWHTLAGGVGGEPGMGSEAVLGAASVAVVADPLPAAAPVTTVRRRATTTTANPKSKPKPVATTTTTAPPPPANVEEGMASWYAAAGPGACAHRNSALGTDLTIVNVGTGERIRCRVVERGPYVDGRVVDLSRDDFARLAHTDTGVVRVRVEW